TCLPAFTAGRAMPQRRPEIERADEAPRTVRHDDIDARAGSGNLHRATAPRQSHFRPGIVADHRAVEIPEAVDLRAAEKSDRDSPALQPILKHLRHRDRDERGLTEFPVANRQWQDIRSGLDRSGFVDELDLR